MLDTNTLLLVGVGAQLAGSLARHFFRRPAQQAQIDRIEAMMNDTLAQVSPVLQALSQPAPMATSTNVKGPAQ